MVMTLGLTTQQTAHLIGNGTLGLLTHPDRIALLRENPARTSRAVHEMLRWCGVVLAGADWDPANSTTRNGSTSPAGRIDATRPTSPSAMDRTYVSGRR